MCDLSRIEKLINQVESGHESINIKLSSLSIRRCQLIHNVEIRELISEGAFLQLSHQANQTDWQKKYRKLPVKNYLLFISCRVSQWQYKKAMLSALGVGSAAM